MNPSHKQCLLFYTCYCKCAPLLSPPGATYEVVRELCPLPSGGMASGALKRESVPSPVYSSKCERGTTTSNRWEYLTRWNCFL